MPLLERARVEVYIPDLPAPHYRNLLLAFEDEFTYAFGGCSILRGLEGSYLSGSGAKIADRINLIYADVSQLRNDLNRRCVRAVAIVEPDRQCVFHSRSPLTLRLPRDMPMN